MSFYAVVPCILFVINLAVCQVLVCGFHNQAQLALLLEQDPTSCIFSFLKASFLHSPASIWDVNLVK